MKLIQQKETETREIERTQNNKIDQQQRITTENNNI